MERTLVLLKPSTVMRGLIGEVTSRFEKKGLRIVGMKMLQLDDEILNEHYAHLVGKPFFPALKASMMRTMARRREIASKSSGTPSPVPPLALQALRRHIQLLSSSHAVNGPCVTRKT